MFSPKIQFGEGWHPEEKDGTGAFRWMKRRASFSVKNYSVQGKKYLLITAAGHSYPEERQVILELYVNGQKRGERPIDGSFCSYAFALGESGDIHFDFIVSKTYPVPGDSRELGIMLRRMELTASSETDIFLEGWYVWEYDDFFPFRWMKKEAKINLSFQKARKHRYISFYIFSEFPDFSQKLTISYNDKMLREIRLLPKWNFYNFPLPHSIEGTQTSPIERLDELRFSLNKVFPEGYHEDDRRELGVRVSTPEFHDQEDTHQNFVFFHKNALRNYQEMREGKTRLESFPLNLGVDFYGKCNIHPPCVYCLWDRMKVLEGEYVEATVDEDTLEGYGAFFHSARLIINCSFGEPLLHPRLGQILEFCKQQKKILEISTNGQSFTPRTIQALVGKPVYLYISLDAARKETYAKIRNNRWETIIPNLILLNEERKKQRNLPKIYMVFMPMRVNKDDLEDYFRLCQKIEADCLALRPLNYLENPQIEVDRGGYHFDYKEELMTAKELEEILRKCDEFSRKYDIAVANQFAFGSVDEMGKKKISTLSPEKQRF